MLGAVLEEEEEEAEEEEEEQLVEGKEDLIGQQAVVAYLQSLQQLVDLIPLPNCKHCSKKAVPQHQTRGTGIVYKWVS